MIAPMFTETIPSRAEIRLRCDHLDCDAEFKPRDAYWDRDSLRAAAAREAAWTQDEVGRDHCGAHRSVFASQRMQEEAEATYPEAHSDVSVTVPDGIPLADSAIVLHLSDTSEEDDHAAAKAVAVFEKAEADEEKRRAYREAGVLNLQPRRGRHHAKTSVLIQLGLVARQAVGAVRREPLVIGGDDVLTTDDPEEFVAPMQQGGLQAERRMRAEFERRGGWLGRPRKAKSRRKRHQKAAVAAETTGEWGIAA